MFKFRSLSILSDLAYAIVKKYLENSNCFAILSSDGITSNQFVIRRSDGLFFPAVLSVEDKKKYESLGQTFSIAKNLDHYQNKICQLVPSLPDSYKMKLKLQSVRVIILAVLIKLVKIIHTLTSDYTLREWNKYADSVLSSASDTLISHQQQTGIENLFNENLVDALSYLGINRSSLEKQILNLY